MIDKALRLYWKQLLLASGWHCCNGRKLEGGLPCSMTCGYCCPRGVLIKSILHSMYMDTCIVYVVGCNIGHVTLLELVTCSSHRETICNWWGNFYHTIWGIVTLPMRFACAMFWLQGLSMTQTRVSWLCCPQYKLLPCSKNQENDSWCSCEATTVYRLPWQVCNQPNQSERRPRRWGDALRMKHFFFPEMWRCCEWSQNMMWSLWV